VQLNDATQGVTWWRWHAFGLGNQKRTEENGLDQEREREREREREMIGSLAVTTAEHQKMPKSRLDFISSVI
jgi:hypothetical protein